MLVALENVVRSVQREIKSFSKDVSSRLSRLDQKFRTISLFIFSLFRFWFKVWVCNRSYDFSHLCFLAFFIILLNVGNWKNKISKQTYLERKLIRKIIFDVSKIVVWLDQKKMKHFWDNLFLATYPVMNFKVKNDSELNCPCVIWFNVLSLFSPETINRSTFKRPADNLNRLL